MLQEEKIRQFARDCVYFKGDGPCDPHLRGGFGCHCEVYVPRRQKTLLIQLASAAGEVIRSSALVHRLRRDQPDSYLMVLTAWPELVPSVADETLACDAANLLRL